MAFNAYDLARALAENGELERASELYEESLQSLSSMRGKIDGSERFNLMEQVSLIGQEYSEMLFRQTQYEKAFEVSERIQGRSLLDLMFRHNIKLQGGRSIRAAGDGRIMLDSPTLSEVRTALTAAKTYIFKLLHTPKGIFAWFVSPDGNIEAWEVKSALPVLNRAISLLMKGIKTDLRDAEADLTNVRAHQPAQHVAWDTFKQALAALYEALFPAHIRCWLENHSGRLLVIPHHAFFHVPWAALGSVNGPSIGARAC